MFPYRCSRSSVSSYPAVGPYDGPGSQAGSQDRGSRRPSVGPSARSSSRAPSSSRSPQVVAVKQSKVPIPRNVDFGGDAYMFQSGVSLQPFSNPRFATPSTTPLPQLCLSPFAAFKSAADIGLRYSHLHLGIQCDPFGCALTICCLYLIHCPSSLFAG